MHHVRLLAGVHRRSLVPLEATRKRSMVETRCEVGRAGGSRVHAGGHDARRGGGDGFAEGAELEDPEVRGWSGYQFKIRTMRSSCLGYL